MLSKTIPLKSELVRRFEALTLNQQLIILKDMEEALANRLKVFEKENEKNSKDSMKANK